MSFFKLQIPKKIDLMVKEFLKTKKNIQDNYLSERLGDINVQREMSKMFKPITETQKDVKESLLEELKPTRKNLKELPPHFPNNFKQSQHLQKKVRISILAIYL